MANLKSCKLFSRQMSNGKEGKIYSLVRLVDMDIDEVNECFYG